MDYLEKFRLKSCCCGCTLRTGTIVIATAELIFGFILLILNIVDYFRTKSIIALEPNEFAFRVNDVCFLTDSSISIIIITSAILLIVGAIKSKTEFLLTWIIVSICCCFLVGIVKTSPPKESNKLFEFISYEVIHIYFTTVVISYYLKLKLNLDADISYKPRRPELEPLKE